MICFPIAQIPSQVWFAVAAVVIMISLFVISIVSSFFNLWIQSVLTKPAEWGSGIDWNVVSPCRFAIDREKQDYGRSSGRCTTRN